MKIANAEDIGRIVRQKRKSDGLTLEEAAEVVDLPLRTAERHWAYARARLATEIERLRRR